MLARSGKVSMATKKRSGEEINDQQILCGMGIKLRRLTAGMGHYTTEAGFQSNMYWSSSPANSSEQYVVSLATGDQSVFEKLGFAYATCYKNL